MGFGEKQDKQPVCDLATLRKCLCPYAEGQGKEMAPTDSFVPEEAMPPLSDILQEEGILSPCSS